MIAMRFVDTNILLYSIGTAPEERKKTTRAISVLDADDLATSVQVLQEFYVQATRPTRPGRISHEEAVALIQAYCDFPVQETTVSLVKAALRTRERFKISYWDAAILEAARALGCDTVLSEDLNPGQDFGGVRVVNPFLHSEP
jgi:predicted nucleic acid-binding protein